MRWSQADPRDSLAAVDLPFKLDADVAADFVARWLKEADYGPEPDIDGDVKKGWRLFTGGWGHVGDDPYAVFGVVPHWALYGK